VDAYRFGLRRLEAALVRGDPVPLHEQIRSQRRAALAGVVLGLLGLCAVAGYSVVVPRPDWTRQALVMGADSGALYVVAHAPDRLVPVTNLAAGRLVLAALERGGTAAGDAALDPATVDPATVDPATVTPVAVSGTALEGAPRTPTAAVPGAIAVRLDGGSVPPRWAVCDETTPDDGGGAVTTVIGGAQLPEPAPVTDGVLLSGPDGTTGLVTAGRRHRVDVGDGRVLAAFGLTGRVPRAATAHLISALPEGPVLATPRVAGRGEPPPDGLPGRVGDVLVTRPVGGAPQYFVVLAGGVQEVPAVVAELLRVASESRAAVPVDADVLAGATFVDDLRVTGWPAGSPRLRGPGDAPVVCWTWSAGGDPSGGVWLGAALPLPAGATPVPLAQADGAGGRVDAAAIGAGGAVRATGPGRAPDAGPLWLVSSTGVAYGVAGAATADALGITAARAAPESAPAPAPEAALRLLPTGPALDLAAAGRVVDGLP
jgi:type VII secretion protein EccB